MAKTKKRKTTKSKNRSSSSKTTTTQQTTSINSEIVEDILDGFYEESSQTAEDAFIIGEEGQFAVYVDRYNTNIMRRLTPEQVAAVRIGHINGEFFTDMAKELVASGTQISAQSVRSAAIGDTHQYVRVVDLATGYSF